MGMNGPFISARQYGKSSALRRVLVAILEDRISYHWHGQQLRLQWRESETERSSMGQQERMAALWLISNGLAFYEPALSSRAGRGTVVLNKAGCEFLTETKWVEVR
jgi:hypothetical protein